MTDKNSPEFKALDTNNDGVLNDRDDPYLPYWPGSDFVDWVGLSVYYFGRSYPWEKNELPADSAFADILSGANGNGGYDFYQMFCTQRNKPLVITETGTAFHLYIINGQRPIDQGPGELAIKRAFWRQYLTNPATLDKYPKIKGVCFFEWSKDEESTFRNFKTTEKPEILAAFKQDFEAVKSRYIFATTGGYPLPGTGNGLPVQGAKDGELRPFYLLALILVVLLQ
jgi:hypothetical protein